MLLDYYKCVIPENYRMGGGGGGGVSTLQKWQHSEVTLQQQEVDRDTRFKKCSLILKCDV
jgi:hypothetical protein